MIRRTAPDGVVLADSGGKNFLHYVLVDEESDRVLLRAEGISGFFVAPEEEESDVSLFEVSETGWNRRIVEDAELRIVSDQGEGIGRYFIGRAVIDHAIWSSRRSHSEISYQFFGNRCEFSEAEAIWRRWASGVPLEEGEWINWPKGSHAAWLHVVQNSWFSTNRDSDRCGSGDSVTLEGVNIHSKASFFCALGEAINGPGGYFGSNLDALVDCLRTRPGEEVFSRIVWRNFDSSREKLGEVLVEAMVKVLREFSVEVVAL